MHFVRNTMLLIYTCASLEASLADQFQYEFVDIHPRFSPSAINAKGQVVGTLFSENQSSSQAAIWSTSDGMTILGTLPAPANLRSSATAIKELGWVAGHSDEDGNRWRPFICTAQEGMLPIPDLGGNQAPPSDIDNSGRVVGWSDTPNDGWRAFLYTPLAAIMNLGTLGGSYKSQASAINKQGWVVGNATVSAKVVMPHQEPMRAFLWRPSSGMVDLGVIPGYSDGVAASAINDKGTVVGAAIKIVKVNRPQPVRKVRAGIRSSVSAYAVGRPFRWTEAHGIESLPTPEYDDVRAVMINNKDIERCPQVKKKLWGGEFWTDGYVAGTVGKHGNEETIGNYVKNQGVEYQKLHENRQLMLF